MQQILGTPRLAILSPESRLAKLIMISSHRQDHRSTPGDALFRSRRHAWIIKGKALAKRVVQECAWCKVMARVPQKQKMGILPPEKLEVPCIHPHLSGHVWPLSRAGHGKETHTDESMANFVLLPKYWGPPH